LLTALTAAVDAKLSSVERVPLALNAHDRRNVLGLGSVLLLPSTTSVTWGATLILSGRTTTMMAGGEESKAA
jgi:hypothetical protein